jgi:hypothetical protein
MPGPSWIRELPPNPNPIKTEFPLIWERIGEPLSPMLSKEYTNEWREKIEFSLLEQNYKKEYYESTKSSKESYTCHIIVQGNWEVAGNWIRTEPKNKIKDDCSTLPNLDRSAWKRPMVYYRLEPNQILIPMMEEMGFRETGYGIWEMTQSPWQEEGIPDFWRSFPKKSFQPRAYLPVGKNRLSK